MLQLTQRCVSLIQWLKFLRLSLYTVAGRGSRLFSKTTNRREGTRFYFNRRGTFDLHLPLPLPFYPAGASIKPIDKDLIVKYASKTKAVVTAENHNVIGGLGSAVAEVLSEHCPTQMRRIGVHEQLGQVGKLECYQPGQDCDRKRVVVGIWVTIRV